MVRMVRLYYLGKEDLQSLPIHFFSMITHHNACYLVIGIGPYFIFDTKDAFLFDLIIIFFTSFEELQIITAKVIGQLRILKYIQTIHMVTINSHTNFYQFFSLCCCHCQIFKTIHLSTFNYSWLQSEQAHVENEVQRVRFIL